MSQGDSAKHLYSTQSWRGSAIVGQHQIGRYSDNEVGAPDE